MFSPTFKKPFFFFVFFTHLNIEHGHSPPPAWVGLGTRHLHSNGSDSPSAPMVCVTCVGQRSGYLTFGKRQIWEGDISVSVCYFFLHSNYMNIIPTQQLIKALKQRVHGLLNHVPGSHLPYSTIYKDCYCAL